MEHNLTESQTKILEAKYHCAILSLLRAAYNRDFTYLECGKCKTKFPDVMDWFRTLSDRQKVAVLKHIES